MLKMSDIGNHNESQVQFEVQIEKAHLPVELWGSDVFGSESNPNPWLALAWYADLKV